MATGAGLIRRVASGGVWAIAGRVGLAVTGLTVNALIARLLSPDDVGVYFLIVSGLAMTVVISTLGLPQAVVRIAAEALGAGKPAEAAGAIRFAMRAGCGLAVLLGLMTGVLGNVVVNAFAGPALAPVAMALIGLWITAKTAECLVAESFRSMHDIRLATLHNLLLGNFILVFLLAALWRRGGASLNIVLALSVSATVVATVIGCWLLQRRLKTMGEPVSPRSKMVFHIAAPMLVTGIMLIVISQADLWIVAWFLPADQVAVYGAAIRLVQLVMVPMLIVNAVLPSFVASLYREGRLVELEQVIRVAAAVGCVPMVGILIVLSLAAAPLLELIYGPHYRDGAQALVLVSAGQVVNGLVGASAVVLMMTGHQFAMMCISIACGALLIVGSLLLVKSHGMAGVAAVTGLSIALHGVVSLLWVKRTTGMWTYCGGLRSIRQVRATLSAGS